MAISVADNFSYQGGKPLDARMKFDTVALMVATPAASLYDGCFAYVKATKKYYSYDSANETDPTLGKWVEYSSGGGTEYDDFTGATSEAAGVHGLVPAPAIADREKFLKGDGTWADVPLPFIDYSNTSPEAMNFSTDEKVIGVWTDGKPLYQKTVNLSIPSDYTAGTTISLASGISNLAYGMIVSGRIKIGDNGNNLPLNYNANDAYAYCSITGDGTIIRYKSSFADSHISLIVTIQYTKTTDTAVASGEKIIGQWIDGKPLYEKIISNITLDPIPSGQTYSETAVCSLSGITVVRDEVYGSNIVGNIGESFSLPYLNMSGNIIVKSRSHADEGAYTILSNSAQFDRNSDYKFTAILRYTKTTD